MSLTLFSRPKEVFEHAQAVAPTTDTGWATYSGGSRLFLPAATNLVTDPQGTAQTLWPADSANTDLTPNQALPVVLDASMSTVTKCVKLVNDGTADNVSTANLTVVASTSYWSALYVYAPEVGGNITITAENGHTFTLGTITGTNAEFVLYGLASPTVAGEVTLNFKVTFAGGTQSTIYITAASLIATTIQQPHFDGTYPNCAWSGTAHASTSTRTASALRFPVSTFVASSGVVTYAVRVVPLFANTNTVRQPLVYAYKAAGRVAVEYGMVANKWAGWAYDGVNTPAISGAAAFAIGTTHCLVARNSGLKLDLDYDGVTVAQVDNTATFTLVPTDTLYIGEGFNLPPVGAYIGPVLISPTRKSDAWVAAIQASSGAAYGSLPRLWRQFMSAGDLLIPLYGNSTAFLKRAGTGSQA